MFKDGQKMIGLKAKRCAEKIQMKKTIKRHEKRNTKQMMMRRPHRKQALPTCWTEGQPGANVLSNMTKQK